MSFIPRPRKNTFTPFNQRKHTIMDKPRPLFKTLRIILGLFLIFYALNKFLHFMPMGYGDMPDSAKAFIDSVAAYLPFLYIFEIIIGIMLLMAKWRSFIYIVLFPLSIAFLMFSIINNDFRELWPALIVALINIILIYSRKENYASLFD